MGFTTINAKAEAIATKPAFREAFSGADACCLRGASTRDRRRTNRPARTLGLREARIRLHFALR